MGGEGTHNPVDKEEIRNALCVSSTLGVLEPGDFDLIHFGSN